MNPRGSREIERQAKDSEGRADPPTFNSCTSVRNTRRRASLRWILLAMVGELWQSLGMGNKDRGKRELKKPKKQTPKPAPARRDSSLIAEQIAPKPTS